MGEDPSTAVVWQAIVYVVTGTVDAFAAYLYAVVTGS